MNDKTQPPADRQINSLYQQRKAQHAMPDEIRQNVLKQAQIQQDKPLWLTPHLWASTFAAVFVIVISLQFLPQSQETMSINELPEQATQTAQVSPHRKSRESFEAKDVLPEAIPVAPQSAQRQQTQAKKLERAASAEQAYALNEQQSMTASSPVSTDIAADSASDISSIALLSPETVAPFYGSQQDADESADIAASGMTATTMHDDSITDTTKANTGSTELRARVAAGQPTIHGQLKLSDTNDKSHAFVDCQGKTHLLDAKFVTGLSNGQWLVVTYGDKGKVIKVEGLQEFKGCKNTAP